MLLYLATILSTVHFSNSLFVDAHPLLRWFQFQLVQATFIPLNYSCNNNRDNNLLALLKIVLWNYFYKKSLLFFLKKSSYKIKLNTLGWLFPPIYWGGFLLDNNFAQDKYLAKIVLRGGSKTLIFDPEFWNWNNCGEKIHKNARINISWNFCTRNFSLQQYSHAKIPPDLIPVIFHCKYIVTWRG
jgi:hypothetical protein